MGYATNDMTRVTVLNARRTRNFSQTSAYFPGVDLTVIIQRMCDPTVLGTESFFGSHKNGTVFDCVGWWTVNVSLQIDIFAHKSIIISLYLDVNVKPLIQVAP